MSIAPDKIRLPQPKFLLRLLFDRVDFRDHAVNVSDRTLRGIGLCATNALVPFAPFVSPMRGTMSAQQKPKPERYAYVLATGVGIFIALAIINLGT